MKLIGKLIFFDLAYLKELGRGDQRSRWKDNEETYFVAALLGQLHFAIKKSLQTKDSKQKSTANFKKQEDEILAKTTIGIVVPFKFLIKKYEEVLNERLLHKFSLSNIQIGVPSDFFGAEKDIMIVSTFRNSVNESLGDFTIQEFQTQNGPEIAAQFDIKLFKNIITRSRKFLWFVGSLETLESTNDRTLIAFSRFLKRLNGMHKKFDDQGDWKKFKLTKKLFSHHLR